MAMTLQSIAHLCLLLWLADTTSAEGVQVTQYPSVTVMRGEHVRLPCHVEVQPSTYYGVSWSKEQGTGERANIPLPDPTHRFQRDAKGASLVIFTATVADAGWYYCQVTVRQRDAELGTGTELIVLVAPSAPQLFLQVPPDPKTGRWSLLCVTGGFHPNHVRLTWTQRTTGGENVSVGSDCTPKNASHQFSQLQEPQRLDSAPNTTVNPQQQPRPCLHVTDSSNQEVQLVSVLSLPPRASIDADIIYTCAVEDHPALDTALSASFTWEAVPNEIIGCLNILKIGVLSGMSLVFITVALQRLCRKKTKYSMLARK